MLQEVPPAGTWQRGLCRSPEGRHCRNSRANHPLFKKTTLPNVRLGQLWNGRDNL